MPRGLDADTLTLVAGSAAPVALPAPLASISQIDQTSGLGADLSAALDNGVLRLAARAGAPPGRSTVTVVGSGCTGGDCGYPVTLRVLVTVRGLAAPAGELSHFTSASPDRVAAAAPRAGGGAVLQDELVITLGTDNPGTRAEGDAAAAAAAGVVSGGSTPSVSSRSAGTPRRISRTKGATRGGDRRHGCVGLRRRHGRRSR